MADLVVDTDIFIDHLRGFRALEPGDHRILYSAVTRAELFAGRPTQDDAVVQLLAPFGEVDLNREIAERAGRLRREHAMSMADAIVAATALASEAALVTRNVSDFASVEGLSVRQAP